MARSDLGAAAEALQMWAYYTRRFNPERSHLSSDAPFPSSVYTGLATPDRPGSVVARELAADLEALAQDWEHWESEHPGTDSDRRT